MNVCFPASRGVFWGRCEGKGKGERVAWSTRLFSILTSPDCEAACVRVHVSVRDADEEKTVNETPPPEGVEPSRTGEVSDGTR